ncbi:MAG: single-stranded-DNA-specific exonuclease RecJ [Pseudomonadota bacterium]
MTFPVFDHSLLKNRWAIAPADNDVIARMVRVHGVPEVVAHMLAARSIAADGALSFLNPRLATDLPNPSALRDMDAMAGYVADAIIAGRHIGIFADFDVDGATSAAILTRFLRQLGAPEPALYIPDRQAEGYGPNINAMMTLKGQGATLVLMADCGTTAFDVLAQAKQAGIDVVIFDHHEAEATLPDAAFVINPKRQDDSSNLRMLAACGVCFMACIAINRALRQREYFVNGRAEPVLKDMLDLVALGTVCDMVPMTGPNRLLTKAGFIQMAQWKNIGLKALCDVAGQKATPSPELAGFTLGPRINAGSRVHQSDLGARLLACDDPEEATRIAWVLEDCNDRRRSLQAEMLASAVRKVADNGLDTHNLIFVSDPDWHVGLNGLVAGQLKEKFGKPACVATFLPGMNSEMEGRGSGRSVAGVNMASALIAARHAGHLVKGGGHAMAGGFTFAPDSETALRSFLSEHAAQQVAGGAVAIGNEEIADGIVTLKAVQVAAVKLLEDAVGPFGVDHPEPQFIIQSVRIRNAGVVGKDHVRCFLSDWQGGSSFKGIAWRALSSPLGQAMMAASPDDLYHVLAEFRINHWQGVDKVDVVIKDMIKAVNATGQAHYPVSATNTG